MFKIILEVNIKSKRLIARNCSCIVCSKEIKALSYQNSHSSQPFSIAPPRPHLFVSIGLPEFQFLLPFLV